MLPERDQVVLSVPPRLLNGSAARRMVAAAHPRALRRTGVGGTAWVAALILHDGRMAATRLTASSGHLTLDSAAVGVARKLEFAPPYVGAEPTCGWFEFPIRFPAPGRDSSAPAQPPERRSP
jgi:TonB family protein